LLEEYRHPDIVTAIGHPLELDYFFPNLNLAAEFQGMQHFTSLHAFLHSLNSFEQRKHADLRKIELCKERGTKTMRFVTHNNQELL
jgi:hypothetical protein